MATMQAPAMMSTSPLETLREKCAARDGQCRRDRTVAGGHRSDDRDRSPYEALREKHRACFERDPRGECSQ
jgi:hypothetical protein